MRRVLNVAVAIAVAGTLAYYGLGGWWSAAALALGVGVVTAIAMLATRDLAARAVPSHPEGTFFAALMSVSNLGTAGPERRTCARPSPGADLVIFEHDSAVFLALEQGRIAAYVNDGILLAGLAAKARDPKDYEVVGAPFSKEPYACMVPENDSKWRDFVNPRSRS